MRRRRFHFRNQRRLDESVPDCQDCAGACCGDSVRAWNSQRQSSAALGSHSVSRNRSSASLFRQEPDQEMTNTLTADSPQASVAPSASSDIVYFDGRYIAKSEVRVSPDDRGFLLG